MRAAAALQICLMCAACAALQNMHASCSMQADQSRAAALVSRRHAIASIASLAAAGPVSAWAVAQTQEPSWKQGLWYDIDGAVGWAWGGKDRCAPDDESCRNNGQVSDDIKVAAAPPTPEGLTVTDRYAFCTTAVDSSNSKVETAILRQFFGLQSFARCCASTGRSILHAEIGGKPAGQLQLGLWRDAAPSTVDAFVNMCNGQLFVPATEPGGSVTLGAPIFGPWSWTDAAVTRVDSGRAVTFGKVKVPASISRKDAKALSFTLPLPTTAAATATATSSTATSSQLQAASSAKGAGYLRVRKRGADDFEFAISTGAASSSSSSDWAAIGQVCNAGSMQLLARLDGMALNKYNSAPLAKVVIVKAAAASAASSASSVDSNSATATVVSSVARVAAASPFRCTLAVVSRSRQYIDYL
eukprot:14526-Heterococcus_DN1.PRE.1